MKTEIQEKEVNNTPTVIHRADNSQSDGSQISSSHIPTLTFGQYNIAIFQDSDPKKFRPMVRITDRSQLCLLDHLWNLKDSRHGS